MWATAIALAYLHKKFSEKKDFWALINDKMTKFIAKTLARAQLKPDALAASAKALL